MPFFRYPIRRFHRRDRVRDAKHFQNISSNTTTKPLRTELDRLVNTVAVAADRKAVISEMQSFFNLFDRYTTERAESRELDWQKVGTPASDRIISYNQLPIPSSINQVSFLNKLAVLKVNGGMGTSMAMTGSKSALEVKNNLTFLDLAIQQIEHLNATQYTDVPLLLMTSFYTHDDTLRIVRENANKPVKITTFNQSRYPRMSADSMLPYARNVEDDKSGWYPPGHGDMYNSLHRSGVLDQLLGEGKEYLFVSNSDNLGAIVDQRILQHMITTKSEFLMEVTDKTKSDVKGGTLIDYDGTLKLLEIAQVPSEHLDEFESVRKFKIFNTNNLWIDLKAFKRIMDKDAMELDIIVKPKVTDDGRSVIQLETAAGAAIKHFKNAQGINVPRSRFLPVKSCSDLLLVKSDLYKIMHGHLIASEHRMFGSTPVVKLGEHFKKLHQFQKRFQQIPKIIELDHLTVTGDVYFGRDVTFRGTVIIIANEGQRLDIPDGSTLENRLVSGNLNMTEL